MIQQIFSKTGEFFIDGMQLFDNDLDETDDFEVNLKFLFGDFS